MKNIIIAAGYATRLYPLTENFPKPLLKVGQRNILERMLDDVDRLPEIDSHIIVTNHRFAPVFEEWRSGVSYNKPITIIDDGTSTNETRLGAVRDLLLAIERCGIDDDIMVLAADNILEFPLRGFVDYFREKGTSVIMCHHEHELRRLQRTGVIAVDGDMRTGPCRRSTSTPAGTCRSSATACPTAADSTPPATWPTTLPRRAPYTPGPCQPAVSTSAPSTPTTRPRNASPD